MANGYRRWNTKKEQWRLCGEEIYKQVGNVTEADTLFHQLSGCGVYEKLTEQELANLEEFLHDFAGRVKRR